ncbi:MAG: hypothetical protein FJ100_22445 [Deltaproteobacteria bacterium]|nr:hypothetical protein [Deltaproteobacteria bacterium]
MVSRFVRTAEELELLACHWAMVAAKPLSAGRNEGTRAAGITLQVRTAALLAELDGTP